MSSLHSSKLRGAFNRSTTSQRTLEMDPALVLTSRDVSARVVQTPAAAAQEGKSCESKPTHLSSTRTALPGLRGAFSLQGRSSLSREAVTDDGPLLDSLHRKTPDPGSVLNQTKLSAPAVCPPQASISPRTSSVRTALPGLRGAFSSHRAPSTSKLENRAADDGTLVENLAQESPFSGIHHSTTSAPAGCSSARSASYPTSTPCHCEGAQCDISAPRRDRIMAILIHNLLTRAYDPPSCIYVLVACASGIFGSDAEPASSPEAIQHQKDRDDLLDAFLTFMCAPRTAREMDALVAALAQCRCGTTSDDPVEQLLLELHRAGEAICQDQEEKPPLSLFIAAFSDPVDQVCRRLGGRSAKIYKAEKRRSRAEQIQVMLQWPQRTSQLLPFGPEDSTRGLFRWFRYRMDHPPASFVLFHILELWTCSIQAQTLPYVVTSTDLVGGIAELVVSAAMKWKASSRTLADVTATAELLLIYTGVGAELLNTCEGLEVTVWAGLLPERFMQTCVLGVDTCADMIECTTEQNRPRAVVASARVFRTLGSHAWRHIPATRIYSRPFSDLFENCSQRNEDCMTSWSLFHDTLRRLELRHLCAAPGCTQAFEDLGRRFRYCSGCLRVPYCSRACMKAAWHHPAIPHRSICSVLQSLCARFKIARTGLQSLDPEKRYEPTEEQRLVEPLCLDVMAHVQALTQYKGTLPGKSCVLISMKRRFKRTCFSLQIRDGMGSSAGDSPQE
jgi:hypothetical protein